MAKGTITHAKSAAIKAGRAAWRSWEFKLKRSNPSKRSRKRGGTANRAKRVTARKKNPVKVEATVTGKDRLDQVQIYPHRHEGRGAACGD
jgi:hypothetical protein